MLRFSTALLVFLTACASSSQSPAVSTGTAAPRAGAAVGDDFREGRVTNVRPDVVKVSFDIDAPPEKAWEALIQVVADLGVDVSGTDRASLTLNNPDFSSSRRLGDERLSRYLRCGSGMTGPNADRYRIRMNFRSQITPAPGGKSVVGTTIQAVGTNPEGTSNARVPCTSTHILESRIAEGLAELVGGAPLTAHP